MKKVKNNKKFIEINDYIINIDEIVFATKCKESDYWEMDIILKCRVINIDFDNEKEYDKAMKKLSKVYK